jgi:regulatory protein
MIITGIRPHARNPALVVIEVDGARFATLGADAVQVLALREGKQLAEGDVERLKQAADVEAAHRVALRLLAARPRSVREVVRRLRERGHNPAAVMEAVGRLEAAGLLNDVEYAEHFVRIRGPRGYGRSRLLRDLLARGVERRTAEQAIDRQLERDAVHPDNQVRALAEKRLGQIASVPPEKRRRRLLAYLHRRGFRGLAVNEVVDQLVSRGSEEE